MITQCPKCLKTQEIPDPYRSKEVKCLHCKEPFTAVDFVAQPPPAVVLPPVEPFGKRLEIMANKAFIALGRFCIWIFLVIFGAGIILSVLFGSGLAVIPILLVVGVICLITIALKK